MRDIRQNLLMRNVASALAAVGLAFAAPAVFAQAKEVKVGLIAPLSGPWARQGELMLKGATMAIDDINNGGGIKSMGGAKLKLVTADAGDSTEKAKNAAQRFVASEPDMIGATGAWLSSFTLAVTEVTERAEMPILTLSYSDQITARGFKYVFQTSPTAGAQSVGAMPAIVELGKAATGQQLKTIGIVGDNTASPVSFLKPMREGGLEKMGIKLTVDEIFTPPLSDATSMVQKLRGSRPEAVLFVPTNTSDSKLILEKMNEMGLGRGRIPMIGNGAPLGMPELLKSVGKDLMEGMLVIVANWTQKGQEKLIADFKKRTGEPWMTQDSLCSYGDMWIFKEALEKTGVADRKKIADAIRAMNTKDGPAKFYPGGQIKFNDDGRRNGAGIMIIQWQNGEPVTVYPTEIALAKPVWPKK
ncbi:MAG: ABC transporter substrate-binding protein [Burkholderiales bacterium]